MDSPRDAPAMASRHVREGVERIARQHAIIDEMDRNNHPEAAAMAKMVLATLQAPLDLMRERLRMECEAVGIGNGPTIRSMPGRPIRTGRAKQGRRIGSFSPAWRLGRER